MPVFFVVAIASLLLAIVELFLGRWVNALAALFFWTLAVLALGFGIDWDRRIRNAGAGSSVARS
jgi:hypothetical protein